MQRDPDRYRSRPYSHNEGGRQASAMTGLLSVYCWACSSSLTAFSHASGCLEKVLMSGWLVWHMHAWSTS